MYKLLLLLSLSLTASCECAPVDYEFKDNGTTLACHGYDDKFRYDGYECSYVSCTWFCNSYKDADCAYVDLTFVSCGNGWSLDRSFADEDGICGS